MPSPKRERKKQGRMARQEQIKAEQQRAKRKRQGVIGAGVLVVIALVAFLFSNGSDDDNTDVSADGSTTTTGPASSTTVASAPTTVPGTDSTATTVAGQPRAVPAGCPPVDGSGDRRTKLDAAPPMCIDVAKKYSAKVETDVGAFTIALDAAKAPKTVNNFVVLARFKYYNDVPFHRVIPGFVVQGGDGEKGDGTGGPGYEFADELPKAGEYKVGSVAMANSGPNTNGSQFFVVTGPNGAALPPSYSLFGTVSDGLPVVKKIEADGSDGGTPKTVHKITSVTITES